MAEEKLARTPLYELHRSLGAKLVAFAGYEMPVQYPAGIIAEHLHTRAKASLFDVSHMGQVVLAGAGIDGKFERLVPADIIELKSGRVRYTVFTNDRGGIIDDLMVAKDGDVLRLVVNASRKAEDIAHMRRALGDGAVTYLEDRALIALQGPAAAAVLARLARGVEAMAFMSMASLDIDGVACHVTRSGYTGEDGYEISVPGASAEQLARRLLAEPEVAPVGLGARDTLRLEAGLCLYGNDIDGPRRRSRPISLGRSKSAGARKAASPALRSFSASWRKVRRVAASASSRKARQIARGHTPIVDAAGERDRPDHQRRLLALARRRDRHGLCAGALGRARHRASASPCAAPSVGADRRAAFHSASLSLPPREQPMSNIRYTKDHEWIRVDGNEATIGITDFAQGQLGDIVFVELPEVGRKSRKAKRPASSNG